MRAARRLVWLPPLFVGTAAAMAVFTSTALLLYQSDGLNRAVGVIAVITALSLGLGLWTGSSEVTRETVPSAARWWVGFLVALVFAAGFSGLWDAFQGFGASRAAQGTGLALMTALPTYFAGGVLGRIGRFTESLFGGSGGRIMVGAVAGMALGATAVMTVLGRPVLAVTAFLGAAIAASLGARIQGWIFDRVPRLRLSLDDPTRPDLRLEVWYVAARDQSRRYLTASGEPVVEDPPLAGGWRSGVADTLEAGSTVHFVGVGAWFPAGDSDWSIYEPDPGVLDLAIRGFGWSRASVEGVPLPPIRPAVVVVDRRCLDDAVAAAGGPEAFVQALVSAQVPQWWVGGVRAPLPEALADAAERAGYGHQGYSGRVKGDDEPPRVAGRWERAWLFQQGGSWPAAVGHLTPSPPAPTSEP